MIEVGYELEMGVDAPSSTIRGAVNAIFPEIVNRNSSKARDKFTVTTDPSVETNRDNSDVEIVTPVWTLKNGLKAIDKLFTLMELMNAQTNASCGLHINLGFSLKSETKKIDEAKLVLLVDEQKWLKTFKRTRNEFVEPMKKGLRLKKNDTQNRVFTKLKNKIILKDKYDSINMSKLNIKKGAGWIEFRIVGGKNYHKRLREVKTVILHFAESLQASTNTVDKKNKLTRNINSLKKKS
jgi:hypothetical protein